MPEPVAVGLLALAAAGEELEMDTALMEEALASGCGDRQTGLAASGARVAGDGGGGRQTGLAASGARVAGDGGGGLGLTLPNNGRVGRTQEDDDALHPVSTQFDRAWNGLTANQLLALSYLYTIESEALLYGAMSPTEPAATCPEFALAMPSPELGPGTTFPATGNKRSSLCDVITDPPKTADALPIPATGNKRSSLCDVITDPPKTADALPIPATGDKRSLLYDVITDPPKTADALPIPATGDKRSSLCDVITDPPKTADALPIPAQTLPAPAHSLPLPKPSGSGNRTSETYRRAEEHPTRTFCVERRHGVAQYNPTPKHRHKMAVLCEFLRDHRVWVSCEGVCHPILRLSAFDNRNECRVRLAARLFPRSKSSELAQSNLNKWLNDLGFRACGSKSPDGQMPLRVFHVETWNQHGYRMQLGGKLQHVGHPALEFVDVSE